LNLLQANSATGTLKAPSETEKSSRDWKLECVDLFKRGQVKQARTILCQSADAGEAEDIFRWMYDNLDLWGDTEEKQDQAIVYIRNGIANIPLVADQEINLSATLVELTQLS
jgi:hypothetical protein